MKRLASCLALLVSVGIVSGCQQSENSIAKSKYADAIIGGEILPSGHPFKTSLAKVVDLSLKGEQRICTATLISKKALLTAAHCLYKSEISDGVSGDELRHLENLAVVFYIGGFEFFKPVLNAKTFQLPTRASGASDLALLQIESAPQGAEPTRLVADPSRLRSSKDAIVAGYGKASAEELEVSMPLRYGRMRIENFDYNSSEVLLRKIQGVDQVTCHGDSGGPAFIEINGDFYLWGVLRRGDFLCSYQSVYTKAYLFNDWIRASIQKWQ